MFTPAADMERSGLLDRLAPIYILLMVLLNPLPVGHYYANAFLVLVYGLFLLALVAGRERLAFTPVTTLYIITIIGHLIPLLVGKAILLDLATEGVWQTTLLTGLLIFFATYFNTGSRIRAALLASTVAFFLTYVYGHLYLQRDLAGRAIALFENPNAAGIAAVYTVFCVRILWEMARQVRHPGLFRGWLVLVSVSCVHMILATQSRKSLLVVLLVLAWEGFRHFRASRHKVVLAGLAATAMMGLGSLTFLLPEDSILNRFEAAWRTITDPTVTAAEEDTGILIRLEFYRTGLAIIRENPVIGQGTGAFRGLSNQMSNQITEDRVTHSTFLDMYIDGGLPAFAAYLAIFVILVRLLWKRRHENSTYVLLALFVLLAAGLELGSWRYMDKLKWLVFIALYYIGRDGLLPVSAAAGLVPAGEPEPRGLHATTAGTLR